jgi:HTH-type transcriptional regulator/antitoxin HipB
MNYPIKTLSQLPLVLKGFRKVRGLTQAAIAKKLGITQQSYAYFEANPATATLERLFKVLRMLDVEISLDQVASTASIPTVKTVGERIGKTARAVTIRKDEPSVVIKPRRIIATTQKKESW